MDNQSPQPNHFEQIQQQVTTPDDLRTSGPYIVSEQPVDNKKNMLINIALAFGIISVLTFSMILVFSIKSHKGIPLSQISPTPATISLRQEYANPFDQSTQYSNPFSQKTNPFDTFDNVSQ